MKKKPCIRVTVQDDGFIMFQHDQGSGSMMILHTDVRDATGTFNTIRDWFAVAGIDVKPR